MMLMKEGKWEESSALLKQVVDKDPEKSIVHFNYGSVLFQIGKILYDEGNREKSKNYFVQAEYELLAAKDRAKISENMIKGQALFLLGDIYYYVYQDKEKANNFYQKSLSADPNNPYAKTALLENF